MTETRGTNKRDEALEREESKEGGRESVNSRPRGMLFL